MTFLSGGTTWLRTSVARHLPARANLNPQRAVRFFHRFLRRQLEHLQILDDPGPLAVVAHQPVKGRPESGARIERFPCR